MGLRVRIIQVRRDGLKKGEFCFVQLTRKHEKLVMVLDRYVEYRRPENRGRFKMTGKWERIDQRDNTLESPPPHDHLKADILKEIEARLTIYGTD